MRDIPRSEVTNVAEDHGASGCTATEASAARARSRSPESPVETLKTNMRRVGYHLARERTA